MNKETMAYKNKLAYIKRKQKGYKRFYVSINPKTESLILDWLNGKKVATYIKNLIKEDIKKNG